MKWNKTTTMQKKTICEYTKDFARIFIWLGRYLRFSLMRLAWHRCETERSNQYFSSTYSFSFVARKFNEEFSSDFLFSFVIGWMQHRLWYWPSALNFVRNEHYSVWYSFWYAQLSILSDFSLFMRIDWSKWTVKPSNRWYALNFYAPFFLCLFFLFVDLLFGAASISKRTTRNGTRTEQRNVCKSTRRASLYC